MKYNIIKKLHHGQSYEIYLGKKEDDNLPVIIKKLNDESSRIEDLIRLKNEYNILIKKNLKTAIRVLGFQNGNTLIMEDIGGISLKEYLKNNPLPIDDFFEISIQIVLALKEIHENNIIHKDFKPSNIIINPNNKKIKLTDFGIASLFSSEYNSISKIIEGTIEYISPEQTGRTGQAIDYRTDFYSLGISFFEMLTGRFPFDSEDLNRIIYFHLAENPPDITNFNPDIPGEIAKIIYKLLSKSPEKRYQSAEGILSDLYELYSIFKDSKLNTIGNIEFLPGKHDYSDKFSIPQKLYGRENDLLKLEQAISEITNEQSENSIRFHLISGYSGIGKTSLIKELIKKSGQRQDFFISGKFEQHQKNTPFFAFIGAFKSLLQLLLLKDEKELKIWVNEINSSLYPNGKILLDLCPDWEILLGPQPPLPEISPDNLAHRFNHTIEKFLKIFGNLGQSLIIFLDDLQWADQATLGLLKTILLNKNENYIYILGAYRDNEVSKNHPLLFFINEIETGNVKVPILNLGNLDKNSIKSLICDTLRINTEETENLSEVIYEKTSGNPFFTKQLLISLYEDNLIYFSNKKWKYKIEEIKKKNVSVNVVDFMIEKLDIFDSETKNCLSIASCFGSSFELKLLSKILSISEIDCFNKIVDVIHSGLIIPLNNDYKKIDYIDKDINPRFKFLHDRVEQAAYNLIPDENKSSVHYKIGKLLVDSIPEEKINERIFEITDQFNSGLNEINSSEEKFFLADLNFKAGKLAKSCVAYNSALNYFWLGYRLVEKENLTNHYKLNYEYLFHLGEIYFLLGNFTESDSYFSRALDIAKSIIDKIKIYNLRLVLYTGMGDYDKSVKIGKEALLLNGFDIPENIDEKLIFKEYKKISNLLGEDPVSKINSLTDMKDPDRIEIVKLIVNLFDSSYLNESFLTSFLILKTMEITLSTGLIPEALISYVNFSVLLSNKRGYEIGKFVVDTINLKNYLHLKSKASHIFCNFINHWTQPLISVNNTRLEGFRAGIESGDIMYSIHNAMWQVWYNFYAGMKFDALSIELEKFLNFVIEHKNKDSELILRSLQNFILDHSNKSVSTRYSKEFYEDCLKSKTKITIICYYLLEIQNYYYLEDYKNAMSIALKVIEVQDSVVGMFTYSEFHYYYTLILIELFTEEEIDKRKIINQQLKMFERYSSNCPENFKHKYYILLAEWARVNEDNLKSIEYYDLSIESADENNFIQDSALLSKLAGKFYLSINKPRFAKIYFKDSIHKFKIWGGEKVANFIINNYLTHYFQNDLNENTTQGTFHSSTTKQVTIDLNSILKASRLLSGEVKLESLLKNLLYLILENAGARKAALVLIIEKEPYIIAEGNTEEKNLYFNNPYPLNISQNIVPATIIRYVYRSKNHLVIDDAGKDENFSHDKYIITNSIHSILCIPVINKGELSALIYLENNLNVGAFTEDRIETIQTLASQFAISLENSLLYNEMEEKVKQRTKELRGALKSVEELKIKQDLDYYLISLLIEPLTNNDYWGEKSKFEYYLNQKKKFSFKNKIHEIGGDINITKPIYLNGEKYTVFLNGDAMGKSSQGAGGVIVLGTALDVIIKRLKENPNLKISPTKWLEGVFKELDNVFKSFDGLMQMSAVIGLLKEETGQIYFINAEQPLSVLIRDKKAEFVEKGSIHNKLGFAFGFEENKKVDIHTLTLEKGDIFLLGSDGRENLFIDGSIDSDSDLFLKLAEEHNGDLNKIVEDITKNGEITDDLSLLKIVRTG